MILSESIDHHQHGFLSRRTTFYQVEIVIFWAFIVCYFQWIYPLTTHVNPEDGGRTASETLVSNH